MLLAKLQDMKSGVIFLQTLFLSLLLGVAAAPVVFAGPSSGRGATDKVKKLRDLLQDRPMVIDGPRAGKLRRALGVTNPGLLRLLVQVAADKAQPGISGFRVGAAALGKSGRIYLGSNVELPGHVLGHYADIRIMPTCGRGHRSLLSHPHLYAA